MQPSNDIVEWNMNARSLEHTHTHAHTVSDERMHAHGKHAYDIRLVLVAQLQQSRSFNRPANQVDRCPIAAYHSLRPNTIHSIGRHTVIQFVFVLSAVVDGFIFYVSIFFFLLHLITITLVFLYYRLSASCWLRWLTTTSSASSSVKCFARLLADACSCILCVARWMTMRSNEAIKLVRNRAHSPFA